MKLSKKNMTARYILFLLVSIMISINAFCGTTVSKDTTKFKLGQHLKEEGFKPTFSIGAGAVSMLGYGTYGITGRGYIPIPLGFRLVTNYTYFQPTSNWDKEFHLGASLQYPLISHGCVNVYASLGTNCIVWKITNDHTSTYSNHTFQKGTYFYLNPAFGLGIEGKINNALTIYNEWNIVNEDAFYANLGLRLNLCTLKNKKV